ncbi:Mor transcription activator family protein [Salinicola sp. JS01]|uniref:Mor transcription activator family protein n=1 Tax=Salinicola sp. JS01 TaxID=3050071 RepID=UPI00255BCFFA|nr:Mor transcription activator family protein [Salinicola sp. JS01]WIX34938.1 Mor transcription activator family protein [Salinicola sp. JS01]
MNDNHDMFPEIPDDALEHMADPEIISKWPQKLTDLLHVVEQRFRDAGADEQQARYIAFQVVRVLSTHHGGQTFYLPRGKRLETALRDREIFETFSGTRGSVSELARRHQLSEMHVYAIIAEQRDLHRRRYQPALF